NTHRNPPPNPGVRGSERAHALSATPWTRGARPVSNRGLHMPVSGVAEALQGHLRTFTRMAKVRQLPGRPGWVMDYKDAAGKRKLLKGGETKSEAELNLALRVSKTAVARAFNMQAQLRLEEHAREPIAKHTELYLKS